MNGKELYELWARSMNQENVGVDHWEELGPEDKNAWGRVSIALSERGLR